jgi:hypothetical protein
MESPMLHYCHIYPYFPEWGKRLPVPGETFHWNKLSGMNFLGMWVSVMNFEASVSNFLGIFSVIQILVSITHHDDLHSQGWITGATCLKKKNTFYGQIKLFAKVGFFFIHLADYLRLPLYVPGIVLGFGDSVVRFILFLQTRSPMLTVELQNFKHMTFFVLCVAVYTLHRICTNLNV